MLSHAVYALLAGAHAHGSAPLPTDCRNNTAPEYAAGGHRMGIGLFGRY